MLRPLTAAMLTGLLLAGGGAARPAESPQLVTGVNVVNPMRASAAARDATIRQLRTAGVRVVRFALAPDPADVAFAAELKASGIAIELIVSPQYPPGAPDRPYDPAYPQIYSGHPLSSADPVLSKRYFQTLIDDLEAQGIVLAGLELGNEINWTAFNGEFPVPGEGKNFSLDDLANDPEGRQIARGYLQYLKILVALKDVRDRSTLNAHTPIISAGLSPSGPAGSRPNSRFDSVSINATLEFLRAHGLDQLVDAYGIHYYPWEKTAAVRGRDFERDDVAACRPVGSPEGKPCWITEWGIDDTSTTCPLDESAWSPLIEEQMQRFRTLRASGRLIGVVYFSWAGDPWAKTISPSSIYRCGKLSDAGRLALAP